MNELSMGPDPGRGAPWYSYIILKLLHHLRCHSGEGKNFIAQTLREGERGIDGDCP